uniref:Uncharacterized protein n=1 Tax=Opuntia streptacantha TaxID=393608 RepID=A0A7C9DMT0_OPUST
MLLCMELNSFLQAHFRHTIHHRVLLSSCGRCLKLPLLTCPEVANVLPDTRLHHLETFHSLVHHVKTNFELESNAFIRQNFSREFTLPAFIPGHNLLKVRVRT